MRTLLHLGCYLHTEERYTMRMRPVGRVYLSSQRETVADLGVLE